jgi:hypothetical protein
LFRLRTIEKGCVQQIADDKARQKKNVGVAILESDREDDHREQNSPFDGFAPDGVPKRVLRPSGGRKTIRAGAEAQDAQSFADAENDGSGKRRERGEADGIGQIAGTTRAKLATYVGPRADGCTGGDEKSGGDEAFAFERMGRRGAFGEAPDDIFTIDEIGAKGSADDKLMHKRLVAIFEAGGLHRSRSGINYEQLDEGAGRWAPASMNARLDGASGVG